MESRWSAEITNNPEQGYALYIELLEDDEYRGRIVRDSQGDLVVVIYDAGELTIPALWLLGILEGARKDLSQE